MTGCRLFRHPVKKAGFLSRVCFFCCTVFGDGKSFCAKMWKKGVCRCLEQKKTPFYRLWQNRRSVCMEVLKFPEMRLKKDAVVYQIPIEKIRSNPYQPRRYFQRAALEELSASIREYGILQPLTVRKMSGGSYELVAGERRLGRRNWLGWKRCRACWYRSMSMTALCWRYWRISSGRTCLFWRKRKAIGI